MMIHTGRAPTRSALTSALGVTRATAGTLVSELQELRLIQVDGGGPRARGGPPADGQEAPQPGPAQQGRPSHRLRVDPAGPVALAAQVHPDGVEVALVGLGGRVVASRSRAHPLSRDPADGLAEVAEMAARLVASAGRPCVGAGLAVPSAVTHPAGTVVGALYLGWPTGTPVRDLLAGQLRAAGVTGPAGRALGCSVGNDINLAALAEHRHGAGRGASHLLMLATGHRGSGGALVLDGALYTGSTGLGMEAGHVSVDTGGLPCPCGSRGCLSVETDAGHFMELAGRPARPDGTPLIDQAIDLVRNRRESDPLVAAAVATLTERLGVGLAGLVNVVNPDRVLLGSLYRSLLEADPAGLRAAVAGRSPWGRGAGVPLLPATLERAALLGAAEIAWQPILDDPSFVSD